MAIQSCKLAYTVLFVPARSSAVCMVLYILLFHQDYPDPTVVYLYLFLYLFLMRALISIIFLAFINCINLKKSRHKRIMVMPQ